MNIPYAILFLVLAYGLAVLVTLSAMAAEEWAFHRHERWRDLGLTLASSVLENFGYRQLTVWWRLEGWWASLRRKKQVWGVMTRTGFDEAGAVTGAVAGDAGRSPASSGPRARPPPALPDRRSRVAVEPHQPEP